MGLYQPLRTVEGDDVSVVHDSDSVAQPLGFLHIMGGEKNRLAPMTETLDHLPHGPAGLGIKSGGRFIQEHDFRVIHEGQGDGESLLLSPGEVLHQNFGIVHGLMTTVHSYTNDQKILDVFHKDLRRARAAAMNLIPTTTGAARVVGVVIPELQGKLDGIAMRVPTPSVSIVDFVANLNKTVEVNEVNEAFRKASEKELKGILDYSDEPLVSMDFKGNPASSIFDALTTMVMDKTMVKVLAWYDNEWGYSCRIADLVNYIASKGL